MGGSDIGALFAGDLVSNKARELVADGITAEETAAVVAEVERRYPGLSVGGLAADLMVVNVAAVGHELVAGDCVP